jgi:hypothetical protein
MKPLVGLCLAHLKHKAMRCLQRIGLIVKQNEEQLVSNRLQSWLVSATFFPWSALFPTTRLPRTDSRARAPSSSSCALTPATRPSLLFRPRPRLPFPAILPALNPSQWDLNETQ